MSPSATVPVIDSNSVGNPDRFLASDELERRLAALPDAPRDRGRVTLLVRRVDTGRRETPERVALGPETGLPGDAWGRRAGPNPEAQLAVMQQDIATLIANGQPLTLFGDNMVLDLDLSKANLPTGSRVRAGGAVLEVTPMPHDGCKKFRARFGDAALRFAANPATRQRNFRGIYLRVIEAGDVAVGDTVEVLRRGPASSPA